VDVDADAAAYYRKLPGALGDRLRQVLRDTEDGTVMTIENGRCPMWRQDGLCRIQAQLGHGALCAVCREFPRLRHDYGDFVELGLELSCPEAARLILTSDEHAILCTEIPGGEAAEYDEEAMATLRRSREELLRFLDDDRFSVPQALAILLLYAHDVQNELDGGPEPAFDPWKLLQEGEKFAKPAKMELILDFFKELEILTEDWMDRLKAGPKPLYWTRQYRALIRYFVLRYWLQAVSDYDIISRAKLILIACLLICAMGGDTVRTAQQFSKEIENDPDNVEAILDGAYTSPALTDMQLLGLLLQE